MSNKYLSDPKVRQQLMAHNPALVTTTITWMAHAEQPLPAEPGFVVDVEPDTGVLRAARCLHCGDIVWLDPSADPDPTALTDWLLSHDCRVNGDRLRGMKP